MLAATESLCHGRTAITSLANGAWLASSRSTTTTGLCWPWMTQLLLPRSVFLHAENTDPRLRIRRLVGPFRLRSPRGVACIHLVPQFPVRIRDTHPGHFGQRNSQLRSVQEPAPRFPESEPGKGPLLAWFH